MNNENLVRHVPAGGIIKPWLILGPLYEDMSDQVIGLSYFEKPAATVGRAAMAEVVEDAAAILDSAPWEGQETAFRGQSARWSLVRRPERYLSWGTYNISNHLGAAFLTTSLTVDDAGPKEWQLLRSISQRILVAVNGTLVFDTEGVPAQPMLETDGVRYGATYRFGAGLEPGVNVVTVGLFRLARMAQVGFRLEVLDSDVVASAPLHPRMAETTRAQVEQEVSGVRLVRDVFYPEHGVGPNLEVAPKDDTALTVSLLTQDGDKLYEVTPNSAGPLTLCRGADLADDAYQILCAWTDGEGEPVTSVSYDIRKVTPAPTLVGHDRLEQRRRLVLEHYAGFPSTDYQRPNIWTEAARYALARYYDDAAPAAASGAASAEVDESVVRATCEFIAARKDCADFVIQGILRLMYWEREQPRLSPEINAMMKDTILGFKYWVDEPGDTVMYMGSENHRLLFHVAEWMAGQLYPTEEFTNSRMRGLYHATKGRMYITEWLRQRGRFGFDEWHSNSYYPICIAPLINVYDFCIHEDYKLQQMTGAVLDYMLLNLAADSLNGVFGTTHGRSYGIYVKYPDFEGTSSTCWLLYGTGSLTHGTSGMSPVLVATSKYRAPKILTDIATDDTAVVESKQRQGVLRGPAQHADFCVYRTPDYMLSGLQDHRKGELESSSHVAQVTLGDKVVIFWTCPLTCGEGSGLRPDYWSGHIALPRVVQHKNVLSLTWRVPEFGWMSHCFFEQGRFDEVRFEGNWAFARVGKGYVGIYSQNGLVVGDYGQYAGRELICHAAENTWLVECGREADWDSFEDFVNAVRSAAIKAEDGGLVYESPSIGQFATGWNMTPTVNGEPIQLHGYPLVDSPWAYSAFGSGELTIRYGDEKHVIWFNQ